MIVAAGVGPGTVGGILPGADGMIGTEEKETGDAGWDCVGVVF